MGPPSGQALGLDCMLSWSVRTSESCPMVSALSFHPVDLALVRQRLIPYLQGRGEIDDLVGTAVRLVRVRQRVAAWAEGAALLDPMPAGLAAALGGRPFLIPGQGVEELAQGIDRYLAVPRDQVDQLVCELLERCEPGLSQRVRPVEQVPLSPRSLLSAGLARDLEQLRRAVAELESGRASFTGARGERNTPEELLARGAALKLLAFSALYQPPWRSSVEVWPSLLLEQAGLPLEDWFIPPVALVAPLIQAFPELDWWMAHTIVEREMVGGLVRPERVGPLRLLLREQREVLLSLARVEGQEPAVALALRQLDEALADAEHRQLAFVEACDLPGFVQAPDL